METTQRAHDLLERTHEIAQGLVADVWQQLPGYDVLRMDHDDLATTVVPNVAALLRCVSEDRAPDLQELEVAAALGDRRAVQGVPIEAVVSSWHRAERTILARINGMGAPLPPDEHLRVSQTLAYAVDSMTMASTEAYRRTRTEAAGHLEQIATDLVSRLAGGEPLDPADIEKRARLVGVAAQAPHRAVAVGLPVEDPLLLAQVLRSLLDAVAPRLESRVLVGSHNSRAVIIFPEVANLLDMLGRAAERHVTRHPFVLAVGLPRKRFGESGGSCREALSALEVGVLTQRHGDIIEFAAVASDVMLAENPLDVEQLVQGALGPLLGHPHLIATLRSHLQNGLSVRATAVSLKIHENTVAYRLRRVRELLKVDHTSELVRADVLMALRALDLTPTSIAGASTERPSIADRPLDLDPPGPVCKP